MTTTTYTVNATELKGVIPRFRTHHEASVPAIHHTFNAVYGIELYDTDFHFLFDNVAANGLNKLYKDALKRLLMHMTDHIKRMSGAITTTEMEKVDNLFCAMHISYLMSNSKFKNFKRGQELATWIRHFIRNQCIDVPEKCLEIQFSTSRIFLSLVVGIVDGLNMNKLFCEK